MENTIKNNELCGLTFFEKIKYVFQIVMEKVRVLRVICSFTSILAAANLIYFFGNIVKLNDFFAGLIAVLGLIGIVSGIIACPLKLILTALAIVGKAVVMGLIFPIPGIFIGLSIGLIIAFFLLLIGPAIITIPNLFNNLLN